jgi:hypothetical protein
MYGAGPGVEPAEVSSLKSLLHIANIIALIFLIIWILVGIGVIAAAALAAAVGFGFFVILPGLFFLIFFVINLLIWLNIKEIRRMVDAGRYQEAKGKTLIWAILGIILGGFIPGIVLLIAYLNFDPVINWQRQMQSGGGMPPAQPGWGAPPPSAPPMAPMAYSAPGPAAATPAPAAPAGGTCSRCGKPATWVAQYNRWYCYSCQQYV